MNLSTQNNEIPEPQSDDLDEYILFLKNFQKEAEGLSNYLLAEAVERKIIETKKQKIQLKTTEMRSQQKDEKKLLDEQQLAQIDKFNEEWDQKMSEYEAEGTRLENELIEKQEKYYQEIETELQASFPEKPKESASLLNIKNKETQLVKQKLYIEATKVKEQRIAMEEIENKKWENEKKNKISLNMKKLKKKQDAELEALRKKIDAGYEALRKQRLKEFEKVFKKRENFLSEITIQHKSDLQKLNKSLKNPGVEFNGFSQSKYIANPGETE